jgi:hypothetical protein
MQPGVAWLTFNRLRTAFEALPDFLVKVESNRVAQRLNCGNQAACSNTTGQRVSNPEGDAEMHDGEGQGLEHVAPRLRIIPYWLES